MLKYWIRFYHDANLHIHLFYEQDFFSMLIVILHFLLWERDTYFAVYGKVHKTVDYYDSHLMKFMYI